MVTPLEAARAVLGVPQDSRIWEDKTSHLFTPEKVDSLARMGPEYYIKCRYFHISPMITGYTTTYVGAMPETRPEIMWYHRQECEIRFRTRPMVRVFSEMPEWCREIQFAIPGQGETEWHGGPFAWQWDPEGGLTIKFRYNGEDPYPHRLENHFSSERIIVQQGRHLKQRTASFWWGQKMERGVIHHIAMSDASYGRTEVSPTMGTRPDEPAQEPEQNPTVMERPGGALDTNPPPVVEEVNSEVRSQFEALASRCARAVAQHNTGEPTHQRPVEADTRMGDDSDTEYLDHDVEFF